MAITAALVKELRERTGAGMMECKKALVEADGDIEAAIEAMRKSGQAKAAKKSGRIAAEGVVMIATAPDGRRGVLVEINCETDFVAKDTNFQSFAASVAATALAGDAPDAETLLGQPLTDDPAQTVDAARESLITRIGENIQVRRLVRFDGAAGQLHSYRHGTRIGVLVDLVGGDATLGRELAMHIAALNPMCISAAQIPPAVLDKEREIAEVQSRADAQEQGKPESVVGKMVEGRIRKYIAEVTLLGQIFVKSESKQSVEAILRQAGAEVRAFTRIEVGEGIEKKTENFAEEVMAQVRT